MKILIKDKSRNGMVLVRNYTAQRKVERQLDEIIAQIKETNEILRKMQ